MEIYAAADKSWVQSSGSFAGFWKFNPDLATNSGLPAGTTTTPIQAAINAYNPRYGDVPALVAPAYVRSAAANSYAVPLSIMSGLFRSRNYLPISQMGEMVLQFTLANGSEACWQATGATDASFTLSDLFMEIDVVQPHYLYSELLNKVTQSDGESGVVIPYESAIVSQGQAITGAASVIVSRATNNLRRVVYGQQLTAGISSANYPSVSCFVNANLSSWQVRCGSLNDGACGAELKHCLDIWVN